MTDAEFRALVLEAFKLRPTGDYHYPFAPNQLRYLVDRAVEAEREACAQVAEAWDADHTDTNYGLCIGNAIRERGSK
jgi:hypothetical protein